VGESKSRVGAHDQNREGHGKVDLEEVLYLLKQKDAGRGFRCYGEQLIAFVTIF